jgi:23S rRNA (pseudouridine1915-N3)-methyltransferase
MVYCYFVGAFKEKRLEQLTFEFQKRLQTLWPVTIVEVPENTKSVLKLLETKAKRGQLVSLDAHGEKKDSADFTRWVTQSSQDLHFFGWGADGPPSNAEKVKMKSLSLSPMTFSHEMARFLLLEQLYRAGATLKGHPYPR